MEKITDIFKELRDRATNPLFVSFVISWLIFNWRVSIGLLLYDNAELTLDGYSSYFDLISKNILSGKSFWCPFLISIGYTFLFPFVRNAILAFNSWIRAWGSNLNLTVAKKGKISVAKYIQLRDTYEARTKLLQDVIQEEGQLIQKYEDERNRNLELSARNNELSADLLAWQKAHDMTILNGEWEVHYVDKSPNQIVRIRIQGGAIEPMDRTGKYKNSSIVRSYYKDPKSTLLVLVTRENVEGQAVKYNFFQLAAMDNLNRLVGTENESINVEFWRSSLV